MRRFHTRARRSGRPVRNREWMSFTTGLTYGEPRLESMQGGQSFKAWAIDPTQALELWDEPTIIRMVLWPQIFIGTTASVTASDYRLTIRGGFIVWKASTITTVSTELDGLDPEDGSLDWLWWNESFFGHYGVQSYGGNTHDFTGGGGYVNVKTKRKIEQGSGLVGAWKCLSDNYPSGSTGPINFHFAGRVLLLNH